MRGRPPYLALDTGSPQPSVALGGPGSPTLHRVAPPRACSERLLGLVDELLQEAGLVPRDLGGVLALRGPGSFTGLRIGLATAVGLHQALGVPVAALSSLEVLAEAGFGRSGEQRCLAVVDALRDHWYVAAFSRNRPRVPLSPARRAPLAEIDQLIEVQQIGCLSGFSAQDLAERTGFTREVVVPQALAPVAVRLAERQRHWDPAPVTEPLYLRGPAVTPPGAAG